MKKLSLIVLGAGVCLPALVLRAQPVIPVITSARVEGASFVFEYTGSTSPPCIPQAADSLAGEWTDLPGPVPGQNLVIVPIDRAKRFFRIRCDTIYSANAAGYATLDLPKGFSMIAHPFIRGSNTLAEVLPTPPEGTMLYKFDAARQVFS